MRGATAVLAAIIKHWRHIARGLLVARPLQAACIAFPAVLFAGLAWVNYGFEVGRARDAVASTTDALAEHAQTVMETIDVVLARVLDHIDGQDWQTLSNSAETHAFLARLQHELPQLKSVFLVNPNGINVASSRVYPMPRFDVHEREYFMAAVAQANDRMFVSAPFRGGLAGTLAFTISRRRTVDGRFDGMVAVTVSPAYFESFYRMILNHPTASTAALVRMDGALLVRFPELSDRPVVFPPSSPLMQAASSGHDFGMFEGRSSVDGYRRLAAFQRLRDLPLMVVYSLNRSVYLTSWWMHAAVLAVCAILLSFLLLATERAVRRKTSAEHATLRRLVEETERRRLAESIAQQSQKMEALGRLTGGVAHDFNNLLAVILASLELALRGEDNPRTLRLLRTASDAAERGAKLTAQMLSFSRKHEVAVQSVDVNAVIRGMDDLLRRTLGPAVRLKHELADDVWPVLADRVQLELALLNLGVNARDAMPDGGELTLRTGIVSGPAGDGRIPGLRQGDYVRVEVADTGVGMSEEVRVRAHEPFFTTKGPGSGTGLGLSMVYGFVRELGGAIAIDSAPGTGTTVSVFLRKADGTPTVEPPLGLTADVPPTRVGRILLVDDDAGVREFDTYDARGPRA